MKRGRVPLHVFFFHPKQIPKSNHSVQFIQSFPPKHCFCVRGLCCISCVLFLPSLLARCRSLFSAKNRDEDAAGHLALDDESVGLFFDLRSQVRHGEHQTEAFIPEYADGAAVVPAVLVMIARDARVKAIFLNHTQYCFPFCVVSFVLPFCLDDNLLLILDRARLKPAKARQEGRRLCSSTHPPVSLFLLSAFVYPTTINIPCG